MALAASPGSRGRCGRQRSTSTAGPLVHLHISYPTGRLRRRLALATVIGAYVDAAVAPLARNDVVTLLLAALVALAAADVFLRTSGTARRAGIPALAAALAFAAVLALGAVQRLAGWGPTTRCSGRTTS